MNRLVRHLLLLVLFALLQIFVFKDLGWWHAVPLLYVYALLVWPADTPLWLQLTAAFVLGMLIDLASDTPGMNAAATVFAAFVRPWLLNVFSASDDARFSPGEHTMGFVPFWKYALSLVLIHHTALFLLESWSLIPFFLIVLRILTSVFLTSLLIWFCERFRRQS